MLQIQARNLLSVLKYSNRHLKDATTSKSIQTIFNRIK
jgi:hypothetical protein